VIGESSLGNETLNRAFRRLFKINSRIAIQIVVGKVRSSLIERSSKRIDRKNGNRSRAVFATSLNELIAPDHEQQDEFLLKKRIKPRSSLFSEPGNRSELKVRPTIRKH